MNKGEISTVQLEPVVGSEEGKARPCVIVSNNLYHRVDVRVVVPLTSWQSRFLRHPNKYFLAATPANHLSNDSAADAMQIRSVSTLRFIQRVGQLDEVDMSEICDLIATIVEA